MMAIQKGNSQMVLTWPPVASNVVYVTAYVSSAMVEDDYLTARLVRFKEECRRARVWCASRTRGGWLHLDHHRPPTLPLVPRRPPLSVLAPRRRMPRQSERR